MPSTSALMPKVMRVFDHVKKDHGMEKWSVVNDNEPDLPFYRSGLSCSIPILKRKKRCGGREGREGGRVGEI